LGSMLNNDREVRQLVQHLEARRPPVTAIFHSQPELLAHVRVGPLDGRTLFGDRQYVRQLVEHLRGHGAPLPPIPHVVLAAAPRLEPRLGREGLGDLWAYARAGLYWAHGSVDNLAALLAHLVSLHPAAAGKAIAAPAPELHPEVALWHPEAPAFFTALDDYLAWYLPYWEGRYGAPPPGSGPAGP